MKETNFIDFLKERLMCELPGVSAQMRLMPIFKGGHLRSFTPMPDSRRSAVLSLLHYRRGELCVLLTLRNGNLSHHAGQISFPGGGIEAGEMPEDAALRETYEEIGADFRHKVLLGRLTDLFVAPSNNLITPVVAFVQDLPKLKPNIDEVSEIFSIPLSQLGKGNIRKETKTIDGYVVEVPHWNLGKAAPLWGATAMILAELVDLYDEFSAKEFTKHS